MKLVSGVLLFGLVLVAGVPPASADGFRAVHRIVTWLPSRCLDLLDPIRLRLRAGPGVAVSVRATEAADLFLGSYAALYAGLPGPRLRRLPKLPVGFESKHGVEVSVADATAEPGPGPGYSKTELGVGFQALILGLDVGLDPMELVDLLGGFFFWDPRHDDL